MSKLAISKKVFSVFLVLFSLLVSSDLLGQTQITPLAHQITSYSAPTCKPALVDTFVLYRDVQREETSKLFRILFHGNLVQYKDSNGINFSIRPFINLEYGKEMGNPLYADSTFYTNGRGFLIQGNIGDKLTFFSAFQESQSKYLPYIGQQAAATGASIGYGRAKSFKGNGFDYAMAVGQIVYRPFKDLQLWFGNGKNFIGNGYRSLFLSDNSANYPYGKIVYQYKNKIEYQVLFAQLSTGVRYTRFSSVEPQYITKGLSAFFLAWKVSPKFEVGLFESTIWNRNDYGRQKPINTFQFNPIIGVNSLTQGLDGSNNSNLGLNLFYKPGRHYTFYSQLLLDGANRNGIQVGASKSNIFGQHLSVRGECNMVAAGTYSSVDSVSNYTNFLQPLAHPMGSGFTEFTGTLKYRWKRILFNLQGSAANFPKGYNGPGLIGAYNTNTPNTGSAKLLYACPTLGFIINTTSNLQLNVGSIYRVLQTNTNTDKTQYLFVRLSTNITNLYFDF